VLYRKWIKKSRCLSEASFGSSHFLYCINGDPAGATTPGSPFFEFFLWRRKERISAAGPRPGLYPRRAIVLIRAWHVKSNTVYHERHWSASPVDSSQTHAGAPARWNDVNTIVPNLPHAQISTHHNSSKAPDCKQTESSPALCSLTKKFRRLPS
jgi:hypothetical protein